MASTRHSSKRHKAATVELALFNSDILASVTPYLDAEGLSSLASTCRHFGAGSDGALSLVQEAALRGMSDGERAALVRYPGEGRIMMYRQLLMLRAALIFDRRVGRTMKHPAGDKSRVVVTKGHASRTKSAFSNQIMRGGKHYAEFFDGEGNSAGIMRPVGGWGKRSEDHFDPTWIKKEFQQQILPMRSERWGDSNINSCMYSLSSGRCYCSDWEGNQMRSHDWEGRDEYFGWKSKPVHGLLLDLDAGTLTAYRNGRKLGIMCEGLAGEYCWVASIQGVGSISIRRGVMPTAESEERANAVAAAAESSSESELSGSDISSESEGSDAEG